MKGGNKMTFKCGNCQKDFDAPALWDGVKPKYDARNIMFLYETIQVSFECSECKQFTIYSYGVTGFVDCYKA
jgi:DNA-directed RNA polymerase subunit RPC12/RpoP